MVRPLQLDRRIDDYAGPHAGRANAIHQGEPVGGFQLRASYPPNKVNEARFGYNSLFNIIGQQLAGVEDVDAVIGVPLKVTDHEFLGRAQHRTEQQSDLSGNPTSSPFAIDDKVYQGVDNFSWVVGKHSLRMGGEYRYNQYPQVGNEFPRGQFFFTGAFTSNANTQTAATPARTSCWAARQRVMAVALVSADFRNHEWAAYLDDTWKVTPHLTISRTALGGRAADVGRIRPRGGNPAQSSLSAVANVSDLSKHPVFVRVGTGIFTMASTSVTPYWPAREHRCRLRRCRLRGMAAGLPADQHRLQQLRAAVGDRVEPVG